jgi:aspartyl-tRNA(Asn)/glutamyl-tRNA(Gln) amidotransferase subunit A
MVKPLHELSVAEAGFHLRAREITAVALAEYALSRIAAIDPLIHSFIRVTG